MARRKRSREVGKLLTLDLAKDREALGKLESAGSFALYGADATELQDAAERTGEAGVRLARGYLGGGGEWFWKALAVVADYFSFSIYQLALESRPAVALEVLRKVDEELNREAGDGEDGRAGAAKAALRRGQAEELFGSFAFCASKLLVAADIDEMEVQLGQLPEEYDADLAAVSALEGFHEEAEELAAEPLEIAHQLLAQSFRFRRLTVKKRFERWSRARESSPMVGVKELSMLSERSPVMAENYGEKRIERVFEQQLDVLFQGLGFTVASARPGEAVADLLCVSRPGTKKWKRFSFLVDAKSSKNPYKLPKSDWRAIADYVRNMPEAVAEIPPLAFVLIVGSAPAPTLPARMKELGDEIGIPVRFGGASLLALLHQTLAAPVPPQAFRNAVVASEPVLSEALVKEMKAEKEKGSEMLSVILRDFGDLEL